MTLRTLVLVELDEDGAEARFSVRRFHEDPIEVIAYPHGAVWSSNDHAPKLDGRSLVELARIVNRR